MKSTQIEDLLRALGCDKIFTTPTVVRSSCPLAQWDHRGGRDKHPSFAVFIKDKDVSRGGCRACGFRGDLKELVYKIQAKAKKDLSGLILFVHENDTVDIAARLERIENNSGWYGKPQEPSGASMEWTGGKDYSDPLALSTAALPLPDDHAEHVDKMIACLDGESLKYLYGPKRRFTDETIAKWKIGWHPGARRIGVPQYDHLGRLVNIGGRFLPYWPECVPLESKSPKWMHSRGFNRELYLFGEDWFQLSGDGTGVVFLTEGAFDVIYLDQCGVPNVAAINGSHANKPQIEKIIHWFDHLVLVMDGDEAGIDAANDLESVFSRRMSVSKFVIPDGRDPNDIKDEEVDELKRRFLA